VNVKLKVSRGKLAPAKSEDQEALCSSSSAPFRSARTKQMTGGGGSATTTQVVKVPKNLQGKVIGSGGATLKDIQSDYGVKLTVPGRDSNSEDVIIEGPADKCEFAKRRVLDIIGQAPDTTSQARAEAQKLYKEADQLFDQANAADSPEESRRLKDLAHQKRKDAEVANDKAAKEIFVSKNGGYGDDQMDLHGLFVKEAMYFVEERLKKVDAQLKRGEMELVIIPGQGIHSDGGKANAKLKPTLAQYLQDNGYPFEEDPAGGQFTISFKSSGPTQAPPPSEFHDGKMEVTDVEVSRPQDQHQEEQFPPQQEEEEGEKPKGKYWKLALAAFSFLSPLAKTCLSQKSPKKKDEDQNERQENSSMADSASAGPQQHESHKQQQGQAEEVSWT